MATRHTVEVRARKRRELKAQQRRAEKAKAVQSKALDPSTIYDSKARKYYKANAKAEVTSKGLSVPKPVLVTRDTLEARVNADSRAASTQASGSSSTYAARDPHYGSLGGWTHISFVNGAPALEEKTGLVHKINGYLARILGIVKPLFDKWQHEQYLGYRWALSPNSELYICCNQLQRASQTTASIYAKLSNPEARKQYPGIRWIKNMRAEKARHNLSEVSKALSVDVLKDYDRQLDGYLKTYSSELIANNLSSVKVGGFRGYYTSYLELCQLVQEKYTSAFGQVTPNKNK